ncbi:MAG TPA: hypothetical protein ENI94_11910 [Gammaproteobacteria bacterium]|nr:hypothetical protein [Gammaproteobacteria bacterium]
MFAEDIFDRTTDKDNFPADIHRANVLEMGGESWDFPEYIHARKRTAGVLASRLECPGCADRSPHLAERRR